jgi:transposase
MTWTPEHRRRYAPAIHHMVRTNAITRLAATIDAIDPPCATGRPRLWSTLVMLQAPWWPCRAGAAWKLLPAIYPPRQAIGSRLERWVRLEVLERALAALNGCLRLAHGRKWRPSAGIPDTQSVGTGPQRGPRGYDAAKRVRGRKRVLLVGTGGLVHAIRVVPASVQDRDTPVVIEPELAGSSLLKIWADLAFNGDAPRRRRCSAAASASSWSGGRTRPASRSNPSDGGSRRPSGSLAATGGSWSITRAARSCHAP